MTDELRTALKLPPIDQVGFVVRDLEQAIALYTPLFGEFRILEAPDMEWDYRGQQEVSSLRLGLAQHGDLEIELIEWISGKTPHKEFLDAGREGLQHLRFRVTSLEQRVSEAQQLGYRSVWYKRFSDTMAAAYLERDNDPLMIEFFESP